MISGKALVVDDDVPLRRVCRRTLTEAGLEVSEAEDAAQARELLRREAFDLVLTDIHMAVPGEGVLLAEELASQSPGICVVVMTGHPSLDTAIPALKHGAADYLDKPFTPERLRSAVERALERGRLQRELGEERALRKELESAYAQLQKAEEAKEAVLSRVSHELRTPLAIALLASTLVAEKLPDDEARGLLAKMTTALEGLRVLVEDVLLYAKLSRRELALQLAPVDLVKVVRGLIEAHRALWERRGLRVEARAEGELRDVRADPALIETALRHLLLNAIRFNEQGGEIVVTCRFDGRAGVIFEDTGIGVPAEKMTNIFDGFYQVAEFWTRRHGGLGIGLATARGIVEAHGGGVSASRRVPRGMTFSVDLPLEPADLSRA